GGRARARLSELSRLPGPRIRHPRSRQPALKKHSCRYDYASLDPARLLAIRQDIHSDAVCPDAPAVCQRTSAALAITGWRTSGHAVVCGARVARNVCVKGVTCLAVAAAILWAAPRAIAQSNDGAEHAQLTSPWFARIGMLDAIYHPSATIATSGQTIPGATATVSNNVTLMFDLGYDITKAFSIQMMGGIPPKPTVTGERTVASLGDLGAVRYG